jgi:hypothetical protein
MLPTAASRLRSSSSCPTLNSRPRKNSRKTTPSSASTSMNSLLSTSVSGTPPMDVGGFGPTRTPTTMYAGITDSP